MIDYVVRDQVAEILFNHPPVNTIGHEFLDNLLAALERAKADREVRAILIASALPGRFCAGLDLASLLRGSHSDGHEIVEKLYARLCDVQFGLGKPSIAAISGEVRGGGITIAISCDMIVADAASTTRAGSPTIFSVRLACCCAERSTHPFKLTNAAMATMPAAILIDPFTISFPP